MAKKSLGVTELEWVCPTCNTRNPGSSRTCSGCGTPQPPDVKFVAPGVANVTKDEAVVKQATGGPDIHCPYCDARNPANAKVCKQCGGDLTTAQARQKGELVSDFSTTGPGVVKCTVCGTENPANLTTCKNCGAPLPRVAKPAPVVPAPAPQGNSSCLYIVIGVAVVAVLAIFLLFMFGGGGGERITSVGRVQDGRWARTIMILGLRPRQYSGWLDEIPADATIGACHDEVRDVVEEPVPNSIEVCGTPYAVDQGTGFAEVVQDCVYQVLEQQCQFTVNEWMPVDTVTQEGAGVSAIWPSLTDRLNENQRPGDREEVYQCTITANDQTYVYETRDFEEYQHCVPGAEWNIVTTESGQLISAEPIE
jgi:ribosomal protein L40E